MTVRFGGNARALLGRAEARAMDREAMEGLGLPGPVLMENAARGAFEAMARHLPDRLARVLVVGGPGNNGGDGWTLCRHLRLSGLEPTGLLVGDPQRLRGDARLNWEAGRRMGLRLLAEPPERAPARFSELAPGATLLVDALFGTGLQRPLQGPFAELVRRMEESGLPVVALDVPSGVCADTGRVLGAAPRCALTVSFGALKRGLLQFPGRELAGRLEVASIGAPPPSEPEAVLFGAEEAARCIARRPGDAHKGRAGRLLLVAGSPGKDGAALLAARGALRGGAGLVTVASRATWAGHGAPGLPEAMTLRLPEAGAEAAALVLAEAARASAVVLGPGLGLDGEAATLVREVALRCPVPVVLDADALTLLAEEGIEVLRGACAARWLTPHPGEAGRLLDCGSAEVQADRYAAARRIAERSGQLVVLKGAGTIVADAGGERPLRVCPHGSPALASGGTGDVLSGLCGAVLATEGPDAEAAASAVVLHALAGEYAARGADRGLLASEAADHIPIVLKYLLDDSRTRLAAVGPPP